ncbi:MAG: ParB N-terminal domain-containing protein [Dehalococcoidia bacterium]|nr:ParB N-terminal domain-containing protein [Dehalococcoidia bacterium]
MLAKSEFADLVASIREQGLVHPVVLHEGRVLDGRNRLLACEEAGVPPRFVTWESNGRSPTEWVLATNLQRRHLTQSQRAAVAAKALPLLRAEAKERQRHHGGTAPGRRKSLSAGVREVKGKASERAAERFGVSSRYVEHATAVGKADPALLEQWRRET